MIAWSTSMSESVVYRPPTPLDVEQTGTELPNSIGAGWD
jgi:hypothetical protein